MPPLPPLSGVGGDEPRDEPPDADAEPQPPTLPEEDDSPCAELPPPVLTIRLAGASITAFVRAEEEEPLVWPHAILLALRSSATPETATLLTMDRMRKHIPEGMRRIASEREDGVLRPRARVGSPPVLCTVKTMARGLRALGLKGCAALLEVAAARARAAAQAEAGVVAAVVGSDGDGGDELMSPHPPTASGAGQASESPLSPQRTRLELSIPTPKQRPSSLSDVQQHRAVSVSTHLALASSGWAREHDWSNGPLHEPPSYTRGPPRPLYPFPCEADRREADRHDDDDDDVDDMAANNERMLQLMAGAPMPAACRGVKRKQGHQASDLPLMPGASHLSRQELETLEARAPSGFLSKHLRFAFFRIYGVETNSGNMIWLRRKLTGSV